VSVNSQPRRNQFLKCLEQLVTLDSAGVRPILGEILFEGGDVDENAHFLCSVMHAYANTGNLVDFFRYLQSLAYSSKAHVMAIVSSDTFSLSLRDVIYRYQSSAINGLWFEMLMMAANGADHGRVADAADLDWIMFVCVLILQSLSINKFTSPTVISLCKAAKVPLSGEGAKSREGLQCWKHTIELVICLVDIHSRCITDCACSYSAAEHYITAGKILETYVDITLEPRLPSRNVMIGAARLRQIIIGALGSPAISVGAVRVSISVHSKVLCEE
jgi:hypothetical protein